MKKEFQNTLEEILWQGDKLPFGVANKIQKLLARVNCDHMCETPLIEGYKHTFTCLNCGLQFETELI